MCTITSCGTQAPWSGPLDKGSSFFWQTELKKLALRGEPRLRNTQGDYLTGSRKFARSYAMFPRPWAVKISLARTRHYGRGGQLPSNTVLFYPAPEPTIRPYTDAELNDLVGEVLTNKRTGRRVLVTRKPKTEGIIMLDGSAINATQLLESFYRNDNEPCGMEEV